MSKKKMMLVGLMCGVLTTGMMATDEGGANEETFEDMGQFVEQVEFKVSKKVVNLFVKKAVEEELFSEEELSEIDQGKLKDVKVPVRKGASLQVFILGIANVILDQLGVSDKERFNQLYESAEFMEEVGELVKPIFNKAMKIEEGGPEKEVSNLKDAKKQNDNKPGQDETLGDQTNKDEEDSEE